MSRSIAITSRKRDSPVLRGTTQGQFTLRSAARINTPLINGVIRANSVLLFKPKIGVFDSQTSFRQNFLSFKPQKRSGLVSSINPVHSSIINPKAITQGVISSSSNIKRSIGNRFSGFLFNIRGILNKKATPTAFNSSVGISATINKKSIIPRLINNSITSVGASINGGRLKVLKKSISSLTSTGNYGPTNIKFKKKEHKIEFNFSVIAVDLTYYFTSINVPFIKKITLNPYTSSINSIGLLNKMPKGLLSFAGSIATSGIIAKNVVIKLLDNTISNINSQVLKKLLFLFSSIINSLSTIDIVLIRGKKIIGSITPSGNITNKSLFTLFRSVVFSSSIFLYSSGELFRSTITSISEITNLKIYKVISSINTPSSIINKAITLPLLATNSSITAFGNLISMAKNVLLFTSNIVSSGLIASKNITTSSLTNNVNNISATIKKVITPMAWQDVKLWRVTTSNYNIRIG